MGSECSDTNESKTTDAQQRVHKVLHIDDDPQLTRLVQLEMQPLGFQVDALNDERQWMEKLLEGNYRVVLLDMEMPHIPGNQLLQKIKQHDGAIQVIILTAYVRMFVVLDSLRYGAEYCVFKPLTDPKALANALQTTFDKIDHWRIAVGEVRKSLALGKADTKSARVTDSSPLTASL
jgi:CheY-like chemotaxis protein